MASGVSEPFSQGNALSGSDQQAMDQLSQDCHPSSASSRLERINTLAEENAAMTIEFLRARLLSERSISKSAKLQAQQLAKKVMDLEQNLQAEMERRRLSQIATEQALTKLQHAGVNLDSEQLDLFVREFDSRKDAPHSQKDRVEGFPRSASCKNLSLNSEKVHRVRISNNSELNDQHNNMNSTQSDQVSLKPNLDPKNVPLDKDEDGSRVSHGQSSETKASNLQASSRAGNHRRPILARGIGHSCRTFNKKDTRLATGNLMGDTSNGSCEYRQCFSENQNKSDVSEWVDIVVNMFDGNSSKNSSDALGNGWTDIGNSDTTETEQYSAEKNFCHSSDSVIQNFVLDDHFDASSPELLVQQKMKTYSFHNAQEIQVSNEKNILENRAAPIALIPSQETEQMVSELQHPLPNTSAQDTDAQHNFVIDNPEITSPKLNTAQKIMLQEQGEQNKSPKQVCPCDLQTRNSDDSDLLDADQERNSFERMTDEPFNVAKNIKELQYVEYKTHVPEKQSAFNSFETSKAAHVVAHEEKGFEDLLHFSNGSNERLKDAAVDANSSRSVLTSVNDPALDTDLSTVEDSWAKDLSLAQEEESGKCMPAQMQADVASVKNAVEVKYCTGDTAAGEGKKFMSQGHSADCSLNVSRSKKHGEKGYVRNFDDFDGHSGVVARKGSNKKETLAAKNVPNSSCSSNNSYSLRKCKQMEFQPHLGNITENNKKHLWKPSGLGNFHKDVLKESQSHEFAARAFKEGTERPSLHQDQRYSWMPPPSGKDGIDNYRLLYEEPKNHEEDLGKLHHFRSYTSESSSRPQPDAYVTSERPQKVLMALRRAKEQIRESMNQRPTFSANAQNKDFPVSIHARNHSYRDYNDFFRKTISLNPALKYPMMRPNEEFQERGFYRDFKGSHLHSSQTGLHNYFSSFKPAAMEDLKQYPLATGSDLIPCHKPFGYEPISNYVDKLNVGKGIHFFFPS